MRPTKDVVIKLFIDLAIIISNINALLPLKE